MPNSVSLRIARLAPILLRLLLPPQSPPHPAKSTCLLPRLGGNQTHLPTTLLATALTLARSHPTITPIRRRSFSSDHKPVAYQPGSTRLARSGCMILRQTHLGRTMLMARLAHFSSRHHPPILTISPEERLDSCAFIRAEVSDMPACIGVFKPLAALQERVSMSRSSDQKPVSPVHASNQGSPLRSLMAEAAQSPYVSFHSLAEAQADPDGVMIMEGDDGGTIYVVCPVKVVRCSQQILERLLLDIDALVWDEPDMAHILF